MKVWRGIFVAAGIAMAISMTGARSARASTSDQSITSAAAASATDALRQALQLRGEVYAGDCAAARSPQDVGKFCSKLVSDRDSVSAYLTGRTFSEFDTWLFIAQSAGGWCIAGTAPLDDNVMGASIPWPQT